MSLHCHSHKPFRRSEIRGRDLHRPCITRMLIPNVVGIRFRVLTLQTALIPAAVPTIVLAPDLRATTDGGTRARATRVQVTVLQVAMVLGTMHQEITSQATPAQPTARLLSKLLVIIHPTTSLVLDLPATTTPQENSRQLALAQVSTGLHRRPLATPPATIGKTPAMETHPTQSRLRERREREVKASDAAVGTRIRSLPGTPMAVRGQQNKRQRRRNQRDRTEQSNNRRNSQHRDPRQGSHSPRDRRLRLVGCWTAESHHNGMRGRAKAPL